MDWLKNKWAFVVELFIAVIGFAFYEKNRANDADTKNQVAGEAKTDAVLQAKQEDVETAIKQAEATPPPAPKSLDDLAKDLNS